MREFVLEEFKTLRLGRDEFPDLYLDQLFDNFKNQVDVEWPSRKTDGKIILTASGWVGFIPFEDLRLVLKPKVPIANLFGMLELAHDIKLDWPPGALETESLFEVYERLANILAKRVLDRSRRGLYREYVGRSEQLPFVRGRIQLDHMIRKPWSVRPECDFQENTPDLADNQIVAWTLRGLSRAGFQRREVRGAITTAYRRMSSSVSLAPFTGQDCVGRSYNRLNEDYQTLHALSRFFLDYSGPGLQRGGYSMLPFLVGMAPLFEKFVAEWLKKNLPAPFEIESQHRVRLDEDNKFVIDLVLSERDGRVSVPRAVLDTKYKYPLSPSQDDIEQAIAYATAKQTSEAILIYPGPARKTSRRCRG